MKAKLPRRSKTKPAAQPVDDSGPPKPAMPSTKESIISSLLIIGAAIVFAFILTTFVFQSYLVDGQSMDTTLHNGDRLIVDKIPRTLAKITSHSYVPHRGDIVIFNQNNLPGYVGPKQLIKRVVGLPGDKVVVAAGKITIFNKANPKGFNPDTASGYHIAAVTTSGTLSVTLGPNQIFVCGDNRPYSEDSRDFGPVNVSTIIGKLSVRILPASKIKVF